MAAPKSRGEKLFTVSAFVALANVFFLGEKIGARRSERWPERPEIKSAIMKSLPGPATKLVFALEIQVRTQSMLKSKIIIKKKNKSFIFMFIVGSSY